MGFREATALKHRKSQGGMRGRFSHNTAAPAKDTSLVTVYLAPAEGAMHACHQAPGGY